MVTNKWLALQQIKYLWSITAHFTVDNLHKKPSTWLEVISGI